MNGPLAIAYRCIALLFTIVLIASCNSNSETPALTANNGEKSIADFIDPAEITNVRMTNVHGSFVLSEKQLADFRKDISTMRHTPGAYKVGGLTMIVTINNNDYLWSTNNHGKYLEVYRDSPQKGHALFFEVGDVNFNNYRP